MDYSNALLSSSEVAQFLRVSTRTLQNYRNEHKIKFHKFSPKVIRYKVGDVVEFVKQNSSCSYQRDRISSLIEKYVITYEK